MLDWLIVGGGLHGSHIAGRLMVACPHADIAVLDPAASALTQWQRRARACGMSFLRSSQAHHIGLRADALRVFAREHDFDRGHALGRYRRPSRALFESHADAVTEPIERIVATAHAVQPAGCAWDVATREHGRYRARHVVLATGPAAPARPDWGRHLAHVFDPEFAERSADWASDDHIVVVGGGISAAQYAIACAATGHPVTLLTRGPLRPAAFDSHACFSGPRCLGPFLRLARAKRPQALAKARNPGTLPEDVHAALAGHLASGAIRWLRGEVTAVADGGLRLADKRNVAADRIVLATGFLARAGALVEQTAARLRLALDEYGYADIDTQLAWAPGLHVAGRPASLQLGPAAGNIRGAQLAARQLAAAAGR